MAAAVAVVLERLLAEEAERRVRGFAADMADLYEREAPRDEGTLAAAFRHSVTATPDLVRLHGEVDDDAAPHGKWIDQPVAEIVPVRAKVLRWFPKGSSEPVFARRVVPSRAHEGWWQRFVDRAVADMLRR